ncbi:phage regulatory CII family protein [Achromobacter xylosoxidans]|uniref:phage regulatory CII family protein n=1 Tax=Alcaligenes xylosoxydans xylosoxydans TaxID=85698 RepID=UPI0038FCB41A
MNTTDAAYHTVHDYPGGSESLGPRVGISPAVLRNKVNPNNETHHLSFAEAQRMTAMTGDDRMLQAWAHERGYLLVKAREGATESDMSVLEQVAALAMAKGLFMAEIYNSLADGGVDSEEYQRIAEAGQNVMTAVAEVKQRMRGMVG